MQDRKDRKAKALQLCFEVGIPGCALLLLLASASLPFYSEVARSGPVELHRDFGLFTSTDNITPPSPKAGPPDLPGTYVGPPRTLADLLRLTLMLLVSAAAFTAAALLIGRQIPRPYGSLLLLVAACLAIGAATYFAVSFGLAWAAQMTTNFGVPTDGPAASFVGSRTSDGGDVYQWGPGSGWLLLLAAAFTLGAAFVVQLISEARHPVRRGGTG